MKILKSFSIYLHTNNNLIYMQVTFAPNYFLFGLSWFSKDREFNYSEINIYILFIHIQFTF